MSTDVKLYNLLISCPSDVSKYIGKIEKAVNQFNKSYGQRHGMILQTKNWESDVFPQLGRPPQEILNKQIVDKADFAVAVFGTKFGTKTENFGSGTEEEIERMRNDGKQVFLYFLDKLVLPSAIDPVEHAKIEAFKMKYQNQGVYSLCKSEASLTSKLREHLEMYFDHIADKIQPSIETEPRKSERKNLVLWVDDDHDNISVEEARINLKSFGFQVHRATSTKEALESMQRYDYSLIISNIIRKESPTAGYELLQKIRGTDKNIPFIIFAPDGSTPYIEAEARRRGAQGSFDNMSDLAGMVMNLLGKPLDSVMQ